MHIESLHIYPLKSARGLTLNEARVESRGLALDRRMMLADPDGKAITQREMQALARLIVLPGSGSVTLRLDDKELLVALPQGETVDVSVWDVPTRALKAAESVNERLSQWFGRPLQLVFLDPDSGTQVDVDWGGEGYLTGFSDGFPVLIANTASLALLNDASLEKGEQPVPMDRFRPNIVINSSEPWGEDRWESLQIGSIIFDLVKPCTRCIMTTQDQLTGERGGPNPMPAMQQIRMSADRRVPGVLFGWNAIARSEGAIKAGDAVTVLATRSETWPLKKR